MFRTIESGMVFGDYPEDDVFPMEKSTIYQTNLQKQGVKTCEFVLRRESVLYFVEAKTSNPRELDNESTQRQIDKYNEYIEDITGKMRHSLSIFSALLHKRHTTKEMPQSLIDSELSNKTIKLVLVVKNAEPSWLIPVSEKLNSVLKPDMTIWNIPRLYVINESQAREKQLIV